MKRKEKEMKLGKFKNGTSYKMTVANPHGKYDFYFYTLVDAQLEFNRICKTANKGASVTIINDKKEIISEYAA